LRPSIAQVRRGVSKPRTLKGDLAEHWSVWVNGNWRVTFRFTEAGAELVDYQDYH